MLNELEVGEESFNYLTGFCCYKINFVNPKTNRNLTGLFSKELKGTASLEYNINNAKKAFKAYIFAMRSGQMQLAPLGWTIEKDISMFLSKRFNGCLLLGTMLISKKIIINRRRPSSFYSQLNESNIFIKKISEFNSNLNFFIPIYKQTIKMKEVTHDGVHFTKYGHNLFYTKLINHILSNGFKYFK